MRIFQLGRIKSDFVTRDGTFVAFQVPLNSWYPPKLCYNEVVEQRRDYSKDIREERQGNSRINREAKTDP